MNRDEAQRIAGAINVIRPDWPVASIVSGLAVHANRPALDVLLALAYVAWDPTTSTPARINNGGPWWKTNPASKALPVTVAPHCPVDGHNGTAARCDDCDATAVPLPPGFRNLIRPSQPAPTDQENQP